ncbi:pyridoxal-dependent decarboxylase [Streptomyces sp. NPDC058527]
MKPPPKATEPPDRSARGNPPPATAGFPTARDVPPERNLGSYTTTWALPEVHALSMVFADVNAVNRAEYPTVATLERECLVRLGRLWSHPGGTVVGCSTTGSTEAAMLAALTLLRRWETRTGKAGRMRPNLVLGAGAHACWYRFCRYWGVDCRTVPGTFPGFTADPGAISAHCDRATIGAVATLGNSETGRYDPVAGVVEALDALEGRTGLAVPVHVDAASGGFVAPFVQPELSWGFELPRVRSVNASGHKFGMTSLGVGWLLWRGAGDCPDELLHSAAYIGDGVPAIGLSFSRSATPILQQHYLLSHVGHHGYSSALAECRQAAEAVAALLARHPGLSLLNPGLDLPVVSFRDRRASGVVQRLSAAMRLRRWAVPVYPLLADPEHGTAGRVVIRPGFPAPLLRELLTDLATALEAA